MSYLLAIDSGNSYIKWGLHDGNQWTRKGRVFYNNAYLLEKEFVGLPEPTEIVISHVARTITREQLCTLISIWRVNPLWIVAQKSHGDVTNGYSDPTQLGSDRWAALIAAWKIQHHACLVINMGTAMTIDALSESGEFLGGIILPGFYSMHQCLLSDTQLPNVDTGDYQDFPVNTNDAIYSGVIQGLLGAIERMYNLLSSHLNHPVENCILSGGSASALKPLIRFPITVIDNLVLEGLVIIANDLRSNKNPLIS